MIKIICDRCSREIGDSNVGYIATNWRSMEDGSLLGDNPHEAKHFCMDCMKEIEEFVVKKPESVIKTSENVTETGESVSKKAKSVSICEEQAPEQEEPKGKRRRLDVGKIMALHNAGWKNKDIAIEMNMDSQAVANVIYQRKKKAQAEGAVTMERVRKPSGERPKL